MTPISLLDVAALGGTDGNEGAAKIDTSYQVPILKETVVVDGDDARLHQMIDGSQWFGDLDLEPVFIRPTALTLDGPLATYSDSHHSEVSPSIPAPEHS